MKFLIDMNLPPSWVQFFEENGFAAVHWSMVGDNRASDKELMHWAADHNCVVLTCDLDFPALLAATRRQGPSVFLIRSDVLVPNLIGAAVLVAVRRAHDELMRGAVLSFDATRARLRILPLIGPRGLAPPRAHLVAVCRRTGTFGLKIAYISGVACWPWPNQVSAGQRRRR